MLAGLFQKHSKPIFFFPHNNNNKSGINNVAFDLKERQSLNKLEQEKLEELRKLTPWLHQISASTESTNSQKLNSEHKLFEDLELPQKPKEYWQNHFEEFCDDSCLLRYLRANSWKVDGAYQQLVSTLEWRHRYQPHLITPEEVETYQFNLK